MSMEKTAFRIAAADKASAFTPEYVRSSDAEITRRVLNSAEYNCARTVFCYVSANKEPDTQEILLNSIKNGKLVCVPYCENGGTMSARIINSFSQLKPGRYGLPEPPATAETVPPSKIDLCIVPCVCADKSGHRIGHGGGYYDKFLHHCRAKKILLCRKELIMSKLPKESFDISCDIVITD